MRFLFLGIAIFSNVLFGAETTPKYPNVDALSYWNRSMEIRNLILKNNNDILDAEREAEMQAILFAMRESLYEKKAISEQEFRAALWAKEDADLKVREIRARLAVDEYYERIVSLQYSWAKGDKGEGETVPPLAVLYSEQWGVRITLAQIMLQRAQSEVRFREFVYQAADKLYKTLAVSEQYLIEMRTLRDNSQQKVMLALQQVALAETASSEAKGP